MSTRPPETHSQHLPSVDRVHRCALVNALRRGDFSQVKALRGLPGTGGIGLRLSRRGRRRGLSLGR